MTMHPATAGTPSAPLTPKEAAARLGVSRSLIYKLCRSRVLRYTRTGVEPGRGPIRIAEEDLEAYLAARLVETVHGEAVPAALRHITPRQ
jgi:excisionase family DNA binding protein